MICSWTCNYQMTENSDVVYITLATPLTFQIRLKCECSQKRRD